ncbi:MAG TPA: EAL domain-containing protein [Thermoanaerobaculia bacterium]|nr:EAL domain-containing protein [Thermoanaerobaculia bacterium]
MPRPKPSAHSAPPRTSLLLRPPLLWASLVAPALATLAVTAAILVAGRLTGTLEDAEVLAHRRQLLVAALDPLLAVDRLEAEAWMTLLAETPPGRYEVEKAQFVDRLERAKTRFGELAHAGDHSSALARQLIDAVETFEQEFPIIGGPFDAALASARLWQTLGWIRIPPPESPWFELSNAAFDAQIAPAYPLDHVDRALAMHWRAQGSPPLATPVEDWLEVVIAESVRQGRELGIPALARTRGYLRPLNETLPLETAARADPELAALFEELRRLPGYELMRDSTPFLLDLAPALPLTPEELHARMLAFSTRLAEGGERALGILDARVVADTAAARRNRWLTSLAAAVLAGGALVFLVWIERHRRRLNQGLRRAAEIDHLTGLANRSALAKVQARLQGRDAGGLALMVLDLDNFKAINDTYGHQIGDLALVAFAERCRAALRSQDLLIRVGGDEFVAVLENLCDPAGEAPAVAERIVAALRDPVSCRDRQLMLKVSIGCATAAQPTDLDELLVEADLALREAKERSPDHPCFVGATVRGRLVRRLPEMLNEQALECHFQPQVDRRSGAVIGLEALVRWPVADPLEVEPTTLVDAVEWLGLNRLLVRNVLARVEQTSRALGATYRGRFWVNLSASDLATPRAAEDLLGLIADAGLHPARLGVELTESLPLLDLQTAAHALAALRERGTTIALDDFTTGSATLHLLARLPLDVVKLDRVVVDGIAEDESSQVLTRAILEVCRHHRVVCLAEGVERPEDLDELDRIGIDAVQGFVLAGPLPVEELAAYLESARAPAARRAGARS